MTICIVGQKSIKVYKRSGANTLKLILGPITIRNQESRWDMDNFDAIKYSQIQMT